jgi:hypothetical protein
LAVVFCRKAPITAESISQDFNGLVKSAQSFYWPHVLKLSEKLLLQEDLPEQLLSTITRLRFEALYRMKLYDDLANEVTIILNDEEAKNGDASPAEFNYNIIVSMRLLLNDIKLMTGRSEEAVEHLNAMKRWLVSVTSDNTTSNNSALFWLWQVRSHIVNGYIRLRNWRAASLEINSMLNDLQTRVLACPGSSAEDRSLLVQAQIVMLTRQARMLFQVSNSVCVSLTAVTFQWPRVQM